MLVVITGASAGVGRATALRFARAGARLALIARDREPLEETAAEVAALGGSARCFPLDVADAQAVLSAASDVEAQMGRIDVWINDAMATVFGPVAEITPEEFRRVTEVTYLGYVHGTMAALAHMRPRNRGTIIQVGSALAYRGIPLQAAYCGAKHAIRGFTDSLRCELIHDKSDIKLTMVHLPAVNTPQFDWARTRMPHEPRPVPPTVEPEVIANAIFAAAVIPQREVWVGKSTIQVILGNMLAPGFLDRYLARNAYGAQETSTPVAADRPDNLFSPVTRYHRTRGRFTGESADTVVAVPAVLARVGALAAGIGLSALAGYGLARATGGKQRRLPPRRQRRLR